MTEYHDFGLGDSKPTVEDYAKTVDIEEVDAALHYADSPKQTWCEKVLAAEVRRQRNALSQIRDNLASESHALAEATQGLFRSISHLRDSADSLAETCAHKKEIP